MSGRLSSLRTINQQSMLKPIYWSKPRGLSVLSINVNVEIVYEPLSDVPGVASPLLRELKVGRNLSENETPEKAKISTSKKWELKR